MPHPLGIPRRYGRGVTPCTALTTARLHVGENHPACMLWLADWIRVSMRPPSFEFLEPRCRTEVANNMLSSVLPQVFAQSMSTIKYALPHRFTLALCYHAGVRYDLSHQVRVSASLPRLSTLGAAVWQASVERLVSCIETTAVLAYASLSCLPSCLSSVAPAIVLAW